MFTATGCKQAPQATVESGYKVITLAPTDRTLSSTYSATIRGRQDIEIYPQVKRYTDTGVCQRRRTGKTGTVVVHHRPSALRSCLPQTALANVEAAKASLAAAQLTYDSKQELYKQNVVSAFDLSTAKNSLAAQAQLAQMKAQEVNARNNLSYTLVKSPADGVVGTLPYRVGTLVSASLPEPLTTVSDNSDMYVYFDDGKPTLRTDPTLRIEGRSTETNAGNRPPTE